MKKVICFTGTFISWITFSALLIFGDINAGCKKGQISTPVVDTPMIDDAPWDEVIAWRKPGATNQQVADWIKGIESSGGVNEPVDVKVCADCDNSLMLLSGPRIQTFINGKTVRGGQRPTTSSPAVEEAPPPVAYGEMGPVYLSWNFKTKNNPLPTQPVFIPSGLHPATIYAAPVVKVAIFDTGTDPGELSKFLYKSAGASCIPSAELGWNFVNNNSNITDDNIIRHGTTLNRFITDQVVRYGGNQVEILPVKTHDENGIGDLFSVLCAFAYARERGVQIINASFGFYLPSYKVQPGRQTPPSIKLLREFVHHNLTKNNILLVAAAGNADNLKQLSDLRYFGGDARNLSQVAFYPASLAKDTALPNVIASTTVYVSNGTGTVSPVQNFSPDVVDIGVVADTASGDHYVFKNPLLQGNETVEGSSYAASIVTGKLCATYFLYRNLFTQGTTVRKQAIIDILKAQRITYSNPTLESKIRNGMLMNK